MNDTNSTERLASALRMLLPMAEAWAAHVAMMEERSGWLASRGFPQREGYLRPEHHAALERARDVLKHLDVTARG